MSKASMNDSTRVLALMLVAGLTLTGCGGGSGGGGDDGGGNEPPPPPEEPPVFARPTAVRVSQATTFDAACLALPAGATAYPNAEVEPHLAIDRTDPNHLVAAWQQDRLSDGGARGLATAVSVDGGTTWSAPHVVPFSQCAGGEFARVSDPWVAVHGSTALQIGIAFTGAANTEGARSSVSVSRSVDGGTTWSAPVLLVEDDGNRLFNDKESLTLDSTDPRFVYAVWDRTDPDDHGPTLLARSTDGGATWSPATTIYDPGPDRQTLGNIAVTTPDEVVHIFFTELGPAPGNPSMTEGHLAVIRSTDRGLTWSAPTQIADLLTVGTRLPSQPQVVVRTGEILGSFAADTDDGTLYAAWQDARFTDGDHDAIALAWSTDGGLTWSTPIRINANVAVPAFTATLAVLPSGAVGVTYYDLRQAGTTTYQPTDVWLATSTDRSNWVEARLAGAFDLLDAPDAGGLFLGDYFGLVGTGSTFVTLYGRTNAGGDTSNRTDIYADRVEAGGVTTSASTYAAARGKPVAAASAAELRQRVSRHLAAVQDQRRVQWRAWRESGDGPPAE
jgi:hypothetical protein